jgi:tetratricopeptide (TPR) repeat protein
MGPPTDRRTGGQACCVGSKSLALSHTCLPGSEQGVRICICRHAVVWAFALSQWDRSEPQAQEAAKLAVAKYYSAYLAGTDESHVKRIDVQTFDDWEAALGPDAENIAFALEWSLLSPKLMDIGSAELDGIVFGLWSGVQVYWRDRGRTDLILRYGAAGLAAASSLLEQQSTHTELRLFVSRQAITYAQVLMDNGQLDEAESILLTNLAVRRELQDQVGESAILHKLATLAKYRGETNQEHERLRKSLAIISRLQRPDDEIAVLLSLAILEMNRSQLDVAEQYLKRAWSLAEKAAASREKVPILIQLGRLATLKRKLGDAEGYLSKALITSQGEKRVGDEVQALHNLAQLERVRHNYDSAYDYASQSLSLARSHHTHHGEAVSLNALGNIAMERSQIDEAEQRFQESLAIFRELRDERHIGMQLTGLGGVAFARHQLDVAEIYALEGAGIAARVQNVNDEAANLTLLGFIAKERGQRIEAKSYFSKSLPLLQKAHRDEEVRIVQDALLELDKR